MPPGFECLKPVGPQLSQVPLVRGSAENPLFQEPRESVLGTGLLLVVLEERPVHVIKPGHTQRVSAKGNPDDSTGPERWDKGAVRVSPNYAMGHDFLGADDDPLAAQYPPGRITQKPPGLCIALKVCPVHL